ncbi:neuroendocrine protein 7B2 isoform X1 [Diaphorina citri]|uniref:Neuroendocrine protein 7B2 n=1 Tax=Diaphorina citri TaxID=121845 RepID=A0A1S3DNA4_DIACI|nr:neuroendocrine protein 7B2 isoform X3 [Diaphorina citri]XP_017304350.1 neuroendocrine protein 7B2 isoform X2 [Diaphorina citri]XP_017304351.1 neuroendocrine protein 7B2 isoform X1 [Diaphorina citri]
MTNLFTLLLLGVFSAEGFNGHFKNDRVLTENLLREVVDKMGRDLADAYFDLPDLDSTNQNGRATDVDKDFDAVNPQTGFDYPESNNSPGHSPSLRDQEYLQQSSLWGHQFVQGGAGEGKQLLKPEGSIKNQNQVKTDATLPAYCNPPNPCPVGYTAEDGCLEDFENSAEYSRVYQAAQECMCDAEHMFACPQEPPQHNPNEIEYSPFLNPDKNPYLQGDMLPIAAKKGNNVPKIMALE